MRNKVYPAPTGRRRNNRDPLGARFIRPMISVVENYIISSRTFHRIELPFPFYTMAVRNGMDSPFHLSTVDPQTMLSAFQQHSQTYFEFMNVTYFLERGD
jgi:hypothetical protein